MFLKFKFIPSDISDKVKELIVWKRFNDFKELYKVLSKYHASLHRRQVFPEFIKPNFFGRFDQKVIDERKDYILKILQFCATQPHLYLHEKFIEFFSIGNIHDHEISNNNEKTSNILEPTPLLSASTAQSRIADDIEQQQSSNKINIENIYSELSNLFLQTTTTTQTASSSPNSLNTNDYDYIKKSLQYIQEGVFKEKQENYNSAFELYKLAVAILIKGIQKETQATIIKIIQEKTQQLLLKAEMIFETKLNPNILTNASNSNADIQEMSLDPDCSEQNRWIVIENFCQLSFEIEPNLTNSHGSMLELNENFKIIKILENSCYLMRNKLKTNSENGDFYYYVLKCLSKTSSNQISSRKSIVPKMQIKYMAKLHKYYENEFTIFLLIEYKKYGELYNYVKFNTTSDTNMKSGILQSMNLDNTSQAAGDNKKLKQINSFSCNLNVNYYHQELEFSSNEQKMSPSKSIFQISGDSPSNKSEDEENDSNTNFLTNKLNELKLNGDKIKLFLAQIVCALESLHSIGIICKDLKSNNILLDDDQSSYSFQNFVFFLLNEKLKLHFFKIQFASVFSVNGV